MCVCGVALCRTWSRSRGRRRADSIYIGRSGYHGIGGGEGRGEKQGESFLVSMAKHFAGTPRMRWDRA